MNDTLANITKTLWKNSDADTGGGGGGSSPATSWLSPRVVLPPPSPHTSLPKDGRQNLQESENLIYFS